MRLTKEDIQFSQLIRSRAGWKCERCGGDYRHRQAGLQCAHIYSRRIKTIRYDPDNAVALCFACHLYWAHSNPVEFAEWVRKKLGARKYNSLMIRAKRLT